MASLSDFRQDISSLEQEIAQLEAEYNEINEKLRGLKESGPKAVEEREGREQKEYEITPPRVRNVYEDVVIPQPLEHEFFDLSILDFFKTDEVPKTKPSLDDELNRDEATLQRINTENLYRLNGVTAFAVNDESVHGITRVEDLRQLGLRFDLFNTKVGKFDKPHYIILNKEEKNNNWFIFKKTVPGYINLDVQWLNTDLQHFVSIVRKQLLLLLEKQVLVPPEAEQV